MKGTVRRKYSVRFKSGATIGSKFHDACHSRKNELSSTLLVFESEHRMCDENPAALYLMGVIIDPDSTAPDFYFVYCFAEREFPAMQDERILVFRSESAASRAIALADNIPHKSKGHQLELHDTLSVASALHAIECEEAVTADVLDVLNTLLDFVRATGVEPPKAFREHVRIAADGLTFSSDLADVLQSGGLTRRELLDAVYWYVGIAAVFCRMVD